ncbi:phospholipid-binding lipoprotein MlaA [uncultured Gammaproteobacteria bacterium]
MRNKSAQLGVVLGLVGAMALLAGCATPPSDPAARAEFEQVNDPIEPFNRYIFEVNRLLDFLFLKPAADTYRRVVPDIGQTAVHHVLENMNEPVVFANSLFQGRFEDTATTFGRFLINSTAGLGGLFDVATAAGLPAKEADFGQTLYTYGAGDGPYLVLPILGPSNPRDAFGFGVDAVMDPTSYAFSVPGYKPVNYGRNLGTALDKRSRWIDELDSVERTSLDFYSQMRSMSRQFRTKQLTGQAPVSPFDTDDAKKH